MLLLENVWKAHPIRGGKRDVLKGINIKIERGDALGILGRNGAGKSTLLRLLGGVDMPSSGRITRTMTVSWPMGFGIGVQASMTGADNARFIARLYGLGIPETLTKVEEFAELGPYFYEPARNYSSGMMGRLLLGLSFAMEFECYLVDEIVGAGDARFTEKCTRAFEERRDRAALIMVTHSMDLVKQYCRRAAVLHDGKLRFYDDLDEAIATYNGL
ncbi:ABC transporter ATP-binding protein [Humitalea sp. 24SJ18S-53]|uniref:ABC transporter ATP-binding protein n=1 Tax=Humitalea sp. 24SJ18S-53 TaxID=3422307 RepID=UPI003D66D03A